LNLRDRDLAHLRGEPVEEANLVSQVGHGGLSACERVPARQSRLGVEELPRPIIRGEDQVVAVEEESGLVGVQVQLALPVPGGMEECADHFVLLVNARNRLRCRDHGIVEIGVVVGP
jgi:hypothetical protein